MQYQHSGNYQNQQGQHQFYNGQGQGYPNNHPQQPAYYPNQPNQPQQIFHVQQQQPQPPYTDAEDSEAKGFEFDDQLIRRGFIKKIQLFVTFGIICWFVYHEPTNRWAKDAIIFWIVLLVAFIIVTIVLSCFDEIRRKTPLNIILLGIYTILMGLLLGVTAVFYDSFEVVLAIGITIVVTIALTIFAFQTKWDFTTMGGILFVSLIVCLLLLIFGIIFRSEILVIVIASVVALIFCIYLVYDIQMMMGEFDYLEKNDRSQINKQ
ncbi:CLUMA_CG008730, isoform A [Clunio marinus]|uniref:CLUMA_CG008730, isoform A n=1 Tax=Clunio marinus TaxID=568069 RepID=A0A1J1I6N5_9DIPT|nr:CLUMA_CG008730, isoform A [Clunio marinus]